MLKSAIPTILICLVLSLQSTALAALAQMPGYGNSASYYKIGGGTRLRMQGGVATGAPLKLEATFGLGLNCGKFDTKFAIENTLNLLKTRLTNLTNQVQTAVAALPGYIICRAAPQLCQLMQNYTVRAEELINIAVKDCQQMDADLATGRDPLEGWIRIGRGAKLQVVGSKTGDIFSAVEEAKSYNPDEGIKWLAGHKAGGLNQPPIRPVSDTARAGYNMLLGRAVMDGSAATGDDPLINIWSTPEAAAKWVAEVVGEVRPDINGKSAQLSVGGDTTGVDDGDGGKGGEDVEVTDAWMKSDGSTPGLGLVPKVRKEAILVEEKLLALIDQYNDPSTPPPTDEALQNIAGKSSSIIITRDLLGTLSHSPQQAGFVKQLAQQIAVTHVSLYAMEARRTLVAGRNEPQIAAYEPAMTEIERSIKTLEREIDGLLYEREFYSRNSNEAILSLLREEELRYERAAINQKKTPGHTSNPFR